MGFGRRGKPPNCSSPSWQTLSSQTRRGHSYFHDNDTLVLRSVLYRKTQLSVCSLLINIMKMTTTMTTMMMHSCRILSVVCSASLQKLSGDKTERSFRYRRCYRLLCPVRRRKIITWSNFDDSCLVAGVVFADRDLRRVFVTVWLIVGSSCLSSATRFLILSVFSLSSMLQRDCILCNTIFRSLREV